MTTLMPILRARRHLGWPEKRLFDNFFEEFPVQGLLRSVRLRPELMNHDQWMPSIDVYENDTEIVVRAEVPGMDKKDIEITLTDGLLTLKGERKTDHEEKDEKVYMTETRYGSFCRTLRLPNDVKTDQVDANYKNGILKIVLPKQEAVLPKKIEVNSE